MFKKIYLLNLALGCLCFPALPAGQTEELEVGGIKIASSETKIDLKVGQKVEKKNLKDGPHAGHELQINKFDLNTGKIPYALAYARCIDPVHKKEGSAICGDDFGLGMPSPERGWDAGEFIAVIINDKFITRQTEATFKIIEQKGSGGVQFQWDAGEATVKLTFIARGNDDKLLVEGAIIPKTEIKSIGVHLLNYPCQSIQVTPQQPQGWIVTPTQDIVDDGKGKKAVFSLPADYWCFYADNAPIPMMSTKVLDRASSLGNGPSALMLLPTEAESVSLSIGRLVSTAIAYPPETRKFHLVLWELFKMPNKEALDYLKGRVETARQTLQEMSFPE